MGALRFLLAHRVAALLGLALLLVGIVILQNLEPIRFEVLFWSFPLPKLVLILGSVALGAGGAELTRFLLRPERRPSSTSAPPG